jgi:hypothetical protein
MEPTKNFTVEQIKAKRVEIDALIQFVSKEQELGSADIHNEDEVLYSMAAYQTIVHLTNAKMWLGKMLEGRGTPFPPELADKANVQ